MIAMSRTAEDTYEALGPLTREDATHGYRLAQFLFALALLVDEPADLARDSDDGLPGWSGLFSTDTVPARYLPFVGFLGGVEMPRGLDEAGQRVRVHETGGRDRGTIAAMAGGARSTLTGSRTVYATDRHGGSRWRIAFATLAEETPDASATLAAIKAQKPAGYKVTHTVVSVADFAALRDTHEDFADITATFSDFAEVRTDPTKQ